MKSCEKSWDLTTLPRKRHDMETLSTLLALCEGNPPVTDGFPSQWAGNTGFDVLFDVNP